MKNKRGDMFCLLVHFSPAPHPLQFMDFICSNRFVEYRSSVSELCGWLSLSLTSAEKLLLVGATFQLLSTFPHKDTIRFCLRPLMFRVHSFAVLCARSSVVMHRSRFICSCVVVIGWEWIKNSYNGIICIFSNIYKWWWVEGKLTNLLNNS